MSVRFQKLNYVRDIFRVRRIAYTETGNKIVDDSVEIILDAPSIVYVDPWILKYVIR